MSVPQQQPWPEFDELADWHDEHAAVFDQRVRDVMSVTVSEPVQNVQRRRQNGRRAHHRVTTDTVDPRVLAAAHALLRPGQRLVIVSTREVRIENK